LRIRIAGVEIAVVGTSREDCLHQLEAAAREVDAGDARYVLTPKGEAALAEEREQEVCGACGTTLADAGTLFEAEGGRVLCFPCGDAEQRGLAAERREAQQEAEHQAARDKAREPDRWP
jgi:hypothetical protein